MKNTDEATRSFAPGGAPGDNAPALGRFAFLFALVSLVAALTPRGFYFLPLVSWLWLVVPPWRPRAWWRCRPPTIRPGDPLPVLCLLLCCAFVSAAWAQHPLEVLEKSLLVCLIVGSAWLLLECVRKLDAAAFQPGGRMARLFLACTFGGLALLLLEDASGGLLRDAIWLRLFPSDAARPYHGSLSNIGFMAYALLAFLMSMLLPSRLASVLLLFGVLGGTLILSDNQSAMVGLLLGIPIVLLLPHLPKRMQNVLPWLLLAATTLFPFLLAQFTPPQLFHWLDESFASVYTVDRFRIYSETWNDILARPWLGYGFHASRILGDFAYAHPHNYAMQVWLELGIFGLCLYLWLLGCILRVIQALQRQWRFHAMGAFFCALCGGAFAYNAWHSYWLGMCCMLFCLFALFARSPETQVNPARAPA